MKVKDFFISYNSADKTWAEWTAWTLEEAGYTTVLQAWDFRPGSNFVLEMQRAASEAERTIAILSPDYLDADYTQPEWAVAFAQDPTGEKGKLLHVRVHKCDLKGLLPAIIYIDLVDLNETEAKEGLLQGINRERIKPSTEPIFPGNIRRSVTEQPRFPGSLPPIWNVPHSRNPNFTGREEHLANLKMAMSSGKPAALTQAIHGLGGVGKTQLALEYAYRNVAEYDIVWWVRSEETATLAADYASLAKALDLPEKEATDQEVIIKAVKQWLEQNPKWLLVFDNAKDPVEVRNYIPQGGIGHVLITSRNLGWRGTATPLDVKVLERKESVDFLLKRTGYTDRKAADALAEALGDLPLALEQAGAYMEAKGRNISYYLNMFTVHKNELLDRAAPTTDYPDTVASTWDITFNEVMQISSAGADLLNLCAFLAPDYIPVGLLNSGVEYLPESLTAMASDPLAFDDAVDPLRRYSLVEITAETISVHRLVQAVTRDRLVGDEKKKWAEAALRIVDEAFPFKSNDVQTWPVCSRLLPHALAAADHSKALDVASDSTGRLLNQMGLYLKGRAQFAEAKEMFERALEIDEAAYGPDHPDVVISVNNFGGVLQDLGDMEGAKKMFERALEIGEATYGPDHPTMANIVNNLGSVQKALGDMEGAKKMFERALEIGEAAYGPDHPTVAIIVNNLGLVLKDLFGVEGAKKMFERALEIDEATYGPDHPTVAIIVNNLGLVLKDLWDMEGAKKMFERALEIDEAAYGPDHPTVANIVNNLGSVLQDHGDFEAAMKMFEHALAIGEAAYGPDHPQVAIYVNNLGYVLQALGDMEGAKKMFERALSIFTEYLGEDHPNTVTVQNILDSLS
ncbi:MAG: tetratricopeptide repeat protein [Methanosarcinaceae archaeon]|nr:tetratricopeptide repeat protein [Methanosarcinaceae archaeon]